MKKRIVNIVGTGYTGTTILGLLLGEGNARYVGELGALPKYLSDGVFDEGCACGELLEECPFWKRILEGVSGSEMQRIKDLTPLLNNERRFLGFLMGSKNSVRYARTQDLLYEKIFEASGSDILVDSTKNLSRAVALLKHSKFELKILHTVRDPRGSINSWNKRYSSGDPVFMSHLTKWFLKNSAASLFIPLLASEAYKRINYEDLLLAPRDTLEELEGFIGTDLPMTTKDIDNQPIKVENNHVVGGNDDLLKASEIVFDRTRVLNNRLKGISNDRFWWSGGVVAKLFGYGREQLYLNRLEND